MIYALWTARELKKRARDDPGAMLEKHLSTMFSAHFTLEAFRSALIESHSREDIRGFLIVLRRK
jgi:hypothetical protein